LVKTTNPKSLLSAIKKSIDDKKVVTWSYDGDGDFTHTPEQWKSKAWLTPKLYEGELRFGILENTKEKLSKEIYGVYHGRFIEMILAHFDNDFNTANATAQLTEPDNFS
jgi:hypothetical protein